MRTEVYLTQLECFQVLIKTIKPEWFEKDENGLIYADDEKCPVNLIMNIYALADKSWSNNEDWKITKVPAMPDKVPAMPDKLSKWSKGKLKTNL